MANIKLSELATGTPAVAATDKMVTVRDIGGGVFSDVLCTPVTLAAAQTWSGQQTFVAPILGTPASGTLTNCTGLPITTGVAGLGAGVATFLATPSSANLAAAVTDETGSGALVFATSPTLVTPVLGVATATSINGLTVTASTGTLTVPNGVVLTGPAASGTAATLANAETLTNKTLTDPIIPMTVRSSAQLDKVNDTLANITGLVVTVVPGTYQYRINLDTVSTVLGGVKAAFKYTTAVASTLNALAKVIDAAAQVAARATSAADQAPLVDQIVASVAVEIVGTMIVTTGGTVQLQFAQNTTNAATSSVLVGSSMEFTRIA